MRRIRNLKRVTATVIVLTVSVAIGVAAWRASGGRSASDKRNPSKQRHEIKRETEAGHEWQDHK